MKTRITQFTIIALLLGVSACENQDVKKVPPVGPALVETDENHGPEALKDRAHLSRQEKIPVFHNWRDIGASEYLFDVPTANQIAVWKGLCEKDNPADSVICCFLQEYGLDMNQYMTIQDFFCVWEQQKPYGSNDDFTVWRLQQYDRDTILPLTVLGRFGYLKKVIERLCSYEPQTQFDINFRSGMLCTLQEFFDRMMFREAIHHVSPDLGKALERENRAWEAYQAQLKSTFIMIHEDNGSAWPMAISGILIDNAEMRAGSLGDFLFALTGSQEDEIEMERHSTLLDEKILLEYEAFMDSFVENEYAYPVSARTRELTAEMNAWKKWMQGREAVSSLLSGWLKDVYDNSTNNVRRRKYIMLKNRYQGYGSVNGDVLETLISYEASDEEMGFISLAKLEL